MHLGLSKAFVDQPIVRKKSSRSQVDERDNYLEINRNIMEDILYNDPKEDLRYQVKELSYPHLS